MNNPSRNLLKVNPICSRLFYVDAAIIHADLEGVAGPCYSGCTHACGEPPALGEPDMVTAPGCNMKLRVGASERGSGLLATTRLRQRRCPKGFMHLPETTRAFLTSVGAQGSPARARAPLGLTYT